MTDTVNASTRRHDFFPFSIGPTEWLSFPSAPLGGQHQLIDFYSFVSYCQTIDSATLNKRQINLNNRQRMK